MEPGVEPRVQKMGDIPKVPNSIEPIYVFIGLILVFTAGFAIIMGSSSRTDIIAHWADRRCDLDVLLSSYLYKPAEDKGTAFDFASNNFKFCIGSKSNDYLNGLFASLFAVLQKQMGAADILTDVMKVLRVQLHSIYAPFSTMINNFFKKFKQVGTLASRIFQHIFMAMKKAAAAATASIFIAISLQTAFLNTLDFVINVIMIVLYIMIALAFIFFLPILPVMFFVTMAVGGIEAGFPGRTGVMGTIFCFAPNTQVILENSNTINIQDITLGTILLDGQRVEAVLEVPGSDDLYILDGVKVSGEHLVRHRSVWLTVKEHPEATLCGGIPTLWSLITSNRKIPVRGLSGTILFSDWEEMPSTPESAKEWDSIVRSVLRSVLRSEPSHSDIVPTAAPCFDATMKVIKYQSGLVPLSSIIKGDWIMGETRWTQVLGVCYREVEGGLYSHGNRMTDGVWIRVYGHTDGWTHPKGKSDRRRWRGLTLITDSGTFKIRTASLETHIVRDFTEVGWTNLRATYVKERAFLTAKKYTTTAE